jgi:hypothetical protein
MIELLFLTKNNEFLFAYFHLINAWLLINVYYDCFRAKFTRKSKSYYRASSCCMYSWLDLATRLKKIYLGVNSLGRGI